jgi:hypothetical protein
VVTTRIGAINAASARRRSDGFFSHGCHGFHVWRVELTRMIDERTSHGVAGSALSAAEAFAAACSSGAAGAGASACPRGWQAESRAINGRMNEIRMMMAVER